MTNDNDEKLTLSEWITFLSGESSSVIGNVLSLAALFLAWVAIMVAVWVTRPTSTHSSITILIIVLVYAFIVALSGYALFKPIICRAMTARKLLNKIMFEDLKNVSEMKNDPVYKKLKQL